MADMSGKWKEGNTAADTTTDVSGGGAALGENVVMFDQTMLMIPTMGEVLELVKPYSMERGIRINIELKNSRVSYEGMEEKILELVKKYGMEAYVVYSSFNGESLKKLKMLDNTVETGILQSDIRDCLCLAANVRADALHPNVDSMMENDVDWSDVVQCGMGHRRKECCASDVSHQVTIRAWNSQEPLYKQIKQYLIFNLCDLKRKGITDFITNVPEEYL